MIRFEKGRGDKLFVREISYLEHSADTLGMYQAVLNSNVQPIVATFPLKTVRKEGETTNYVIDMTDYIRKDNEMFSFTSRVKDNIGASSMVDDASYIDTLKAFPQNIEIRTVRTFQRKKGGGSGLEKLLAAFFATSTTPLTYELNSSMLLLPKEPMKPRLHDDRVGYFAVSYKDFDENPQGVKYKANITRWRLEPKDEDREKYLRGELVEPKKPIIIYIDPATPKKWGSVPYSGSERLAKPLLRKQDSKCNLRQRSTDGRSYLELGRRPPFGYRVQAFRYSECKRTSRARPSQR